MNRDHVGVSELRIPFLFLYVLKFEGVTANPSLFEALISDDLFVRLLYVY